MQTLSEHRLFDDAPLYIRWNAENPLVSVELKLDLVARIVRQIDAAETLNTEIGGILLGTPPNALSQTLRVDDFEMIRRRPEDGQVFMLDPKEHDRFLTTRWEAKTRGRNVVGLFRTHLRAGPLRPSLADRTLLASEFNEQMHLILLIQGRPPRTAAIFIGSRTALSEDPSVPEFRFDEAEFKGLPELSTSPVLPVEDLRFERRNRWFAGVGVFVLALLAAGFYFWFAPADFQRYFSSSPGLDLAVTGDRTIKIVWDHSASAIGKALSAKLVIRDGQNDREIPIGLDELRLGTVEYQTGHPEGQVTLVLEMPGAASLVQTAAWHTPS